MDRYIDVRVDTEEIDFTSALYISWDFEVIVTPMVLMNSNHF